MSDNLDSIAEAQSAAVSSEDTLVKDVNKKKSRTKKTSASKAKVKKSVTKSARKSLKKTNVTQEDNLGNIKESESLPLGTSLDCDELGSIELKLSKALHRKLIKQAHDEGVEVGEFISELLSEGVVLRAWEILERKSAMKGSSTGNSGNYRNKGQGGNSKGYKNKGHRMSHGRYQSIMDDSSNFMEYVRNQERGRR